MKKTIFFNSLGFLILASFLLSGCQTVTLHALGSHPLPVMHEPKTDKSDREEKIISANLHGAILDSTPNTYDILGGGASLNFTYRAGGALSWLFASATLSGSYGKLKLNCDDEDCNLLYKAITERKDSYSFASIQEGARVGVEFTPGFFTTGLSGGIHLYQDLGEFETFRDSLKQVNLIEGNASNGFFPEARAWVGVRLGPSGNYGTINLESVFQFLADDIESSLMFNFGYFHPTGWHAGVLTGGSAFSLTAGKSFSF